MFVKSVSWCLNQLGRICLLKGKSERKHSWPTNCCPTRMPKVVLPFHCQRREKPAETSRTWAEVRWNNRAKSGFQCCNQNTRKNKRKRKMGALIGLSESKLSTHAMNSRVCEEMGGIFGPVFQFFACVALVDGEHNDRTRLKSDQVKVKWQRNVKEGMGTVGCSKESVAAATTTTTKTRLAMVAIVSLQREHVCLSFPVCWTEC